MSLPLNFFTSTLLLLLFTTAVKSQSYTVKTEHFTTEDGLSHNAVNSLYEDSRGLLWLSTRYGVNRFDGREFRHYTKEANGIHDNEIQQVFEDPDGTLWLLTGMNGFVQAAFYGNFGFTLFDAYAERVIGPSDYLTEELRAALIRCDVYVQLPDKSLVFLSNEGFLVHYRGRNDYSIRELTGDFTLQEMIRPVAINDSLIYISNDKDKQAEGSVSFFSTEGTFIENGLVGKFNEIPDYEMEEYFPRRAAPSGWFWRLKDKKGNGSFFLTAEHARRNLHDLRKIFPELEGTSNPRLLHIDGTRNRYFVATDAGILALKPGSGEVARIPGVRLGGYSFSDQAGNLYTIDQRNGLYRYSFIPNHFERVGLPNQNYRGLTVGPDGSLWAAIEKSTYNDQTRQLRQTSGIVVPHNQTVFRDKEDNVWTGLPASLTPAISNSRSFLLRHPAGDPARADTFHLDQPINQEIWSIWEDPLDGFIWSANTHGKIVRTDPVTGRSELLPFLRDERWHELTLTYNFVRCCNNQLWISTSRGLYKINKNQEIEAVYSADEPGDHHLPASSIHHIYVDADGVFWLSTGDAGLLKWSPRGDFPTRQYTLADGFPSMVSHATYEDSLGYLWIPTEDGIVQFNKSTELIKVYRPEQGTSDTEYNRISHYRHPDGMLYFGGLTGITRFHPRDFHRIAEQNTRRSYINPIDVLRYDLETAAEESLTAGVLRAGNPIVLTPAKPRAIINLLPGPAANRAYFISSRFAGKEEGSRNAVDNRITIGDLAYGKHLLVLSAETIDGQLLEEREFNITVIRPYYLRWWFLLLAAVTLVAAGLGIAGFENQRLRSLVRDRTWKIEQDKELIRHQAEELRQLDELKSRFFANISHELRTPLSLVMAPINRMLGRADRADDTFHDLRRAHRNGGRLLRMVNEILDLSKLEDGSLKVHAEGTPLRSFLSRTVDDFYVLAQQQSIRLTHQIDIDDALRVELDRDKTETVIRNLLSNALKFTPRGESVALSARFTDGHLHLKVTDTGRGIDARDLPQLFNRFYQARFGPHSVEGGTGIGLTTSREFCRLMGGDIFVRSEPERGSEFSIILPLTPLEEGGEVRALTQVQGIPGEAGGDNCAETSDPSLPLLLVVEDNPDLLEYITEVLSNDFRLLRAPNGRVALDTLRERLATDTLPDLIITDLMMPEMDGFELLGHLKEDSRMALIPVIVLSARAAMSDRLHVLRTGVDDYLLKPFNEPELVQRVHNLLANAHARTQAHRRFVASVASENPAGTAAASSEQGEENSPSVSSEDARWLAQVRGLIEENMASESFGNDDLAAALFVSTRTLGRRVKLLTGLSTNKLILEVRMEVARRLLEQSPRPRLDTVAEAIGFRKTAYFSARFRERFGVAPSSY